MKLLYGHDKLKKFREGVRDGIPIGLGYLAVSFSLGILAKDVGFSPIQGFLVSFFNNASAGEYAGFTLIAASATYLQVAIMTFIANARYFLMSTALSQKLSPDMPFIHRMLIAFDVTDEIFAISVSQEGYLNPFYCYGAFFVALPGWAFGTMFGIMAGSILPVRLVSALSVALYGMFIACTIPKARENKVILGIVCVSYVLSYLSYKLEVLKAISSGTKTIILTIVIAAVVAFLFPRSEDEYES